MSEQAVVLAGEYTIHTVGERIGALALELERGVSRFDASGITDFDTAGLQLMVAARNSVRLRGQELLLGTPSAAVKAVLASYGLDANLNPSEAP